MSESSSHRNDIIGIFARHPVAANLVMLIMLISGALALSQLNTQFFPNFSIQMVTVRVVWPGATAEDVERSITIPIEQELRSVEELDKITSTSARNVSLIILEFPEGTDMGDATNRVEERVKAVRNLPKDARTPQVSHVINFEPIAKLLIHGPGDPAELRQLAYRFEEELLRRGVAKVTINGLPEEELAVQLTTRQLEALQMSLSEIGRGISQRSVDLPAGQIGRDDVARELRALSQKRTPLGFERLPIVAGEESARLLLGDVADIERRARPGEITFSYRGRPAVELDAQRATTGDTLESATILRKWLEETRVAALALMWLAGGSINMISLFALIMTLGIIVDDAIVVGEDALTHYQRGERPLHAAEGGARRMLAPVLSSSLTTVAAFVPLMAVSGIIGSILFAIPFVVICVILASLVESFLVLPGHLTHSFRRAHHKAPSPLASLILAVGLIVGGRLGFTFFPTVEGNVVYASASFVSGTPPERVEKFIQGVERALYETEAALGGGLIRVARVNHGMGIFSNTSSGRAGEQFASITVELVPSDERKVRNEQFLEEWRKRFEDVPGETLEGVSGVEDDMPYGYQQLVFELTPMGRSRGLTERGCAVRQPQPDLHQGAR